MVDRLDTLHYCFKRRVECDEADVYLFTPFYSFEIVHRSVSHDFARALKPAPLLRLISRSIILIARHDINSS